MADFAPNFTARYRLHYTALGKNHTMLWRIARGSGNSGITIMAAKIGAFLDSLAAVRFTNWLATSAEYAPEDVDIFAPVGLPVIAAGTVAVPTEFVSQSTLSISFVGRSTHGQKARLFIWGTASSPELGTTTIADNFRLTGVESPQVATAVNILNAGNPQITASDNFPVTFYNYVNSKYNDHWVAKVRS